MEIIRTLTGDMIPERAGAVYYHEHVIARSPVSREKEPDLELCDIDRMVSEVKLFKEAGGTLLWGEFPLKAGNIRKKWNSHSGNRRLWSERASQ